MALREKTKILVTGFEPFGGDSFNPSSEAVRRLDDTEQYRLLKVTLPVTWQETVPTLFRAWDSFSPDAVLMTGLAGGSDRIRVERVGINLCGASRDNDGRYPDGSSDNAVEKIISSHGADAYFATYDDKGILAALRGAGIPAAFSFSAGTYLCNHILYSALEKNKMEAGKVSIGFLHLPYAEGMKPDVPALPMDTLVEALKLALAHMIKEET